MLNSMTKTKPIGYPFRRTKNGTIINQPPRGARPMAMPERTKEIIKKSKDDTTFLEKTIEDQVTLINACDTVFGTMYDTLVDAEHLLAEENADDIYSIGSLKDAVGEMSQRVTIWREAQTTAATAG